MERVLNRDIAVTANINVLMALTSCAAVRMIVVYMFSGVKLSLYIR